MDYSIELWIEYFLRFSHLVAGIAWIGSSFYFIWLDSSFEVPKVPRKNVEGELYMVHGGFYYQVEKRKIFPGELPETLHWFKWEATLTWFTGFLLLIVLYYMRGASLLIDPQVSEWTQWQAVGASLAIIVGAWIVYDLVWYDKLIKSFPVSVFLSALLVVGLIYLNAQIFSGRGAFIQTGVVLGSLMLLNVWIRILPGQSKMLKEAQAGQVPDYSVSVKSKIRSVHNTYFTFPVLFIMLSNHYPLLYNHEKNWLILILLSVSGALVRHAMVCKRPVERWTLLPAALGILALVFVAAVKPNETASGEGPVPFETVHNIMSERCLSCHSTRNTDDIFKVAPNGIVLETEAQLVSFSERIRMQVVVAKAMPLGNKTGMTEEERNIISRWLDGQIRKHD